MFFTNNKKKIDAEDAEDAEDDILASEKRLNHQKENTF